MVKTLAVEGVRREITANAVLPGMVATEKVARDAPLRSSSGCGRTLPSGRMAEPAE